MQFSFYSLYHLGKSEVRWNGKRKTRKRDETKHSSIDQDLGEKRMNRENIHLLFLLFCPIEFHSFLGSVYVKAYYLYDTDLLSMFKNEEKRE